MPKDGGIVGIDTALMNAKIAFAIIMVLTYGAYLARGIFGITKRGN
jgi:hypothetical protein